RGCGAGARGQAWLRPVPGRPRPRRRRSGRTGARLESIGSHSAFLTRENAARIPPVPDRTSRPPLTEDEQRRRRLAVRDLMPTTPFIAGLGVVIERYDPHELTLRLPSRRDLTNH